MTSIKADKRLLFLILSFLLLSDVGVVSLLSLFLSKGKTMLIAAALSVVIFAFSVWIFLYFSSVKYEKEEGSLKITSGILIKKFTCISTETPYTVVVYHLPFRTGFALIFTYGGMQIVLNKEIL